VTCKSRLAPGYLFGAHTANDEKTRIIHSPSLHFVHPSWAMGEHDSSYRQQETAVHVFSFQNKDQNDTIPRSGPCPAETRAATGRRRAAPGAACARYHE